MAVDVRIDAGNDALSGCFLVTCGAVHLSGKEEILYFLCFQRVFQLGRVEVIIFDGIARPVDDHIPESGNLLQCRNLNLHRQGGGETVQVEFLGGFAFRLQEKLVLRFVGEGDDFGLDAGAVTRSDALYLSVEKGRFRQSFTQDAVCFLVGETGPAGQLFQVAYAGIHEGELVEVAFALLYLHLLVVYASSVDAHRRSRLHPSEGDAVAGDGFGQFVSRRFRHSSAGQHDTPHVHQSVEEGARSQHHTFGAERDAPCGDYSCDFSVFNEDLAHGVLPDV